MGAKMKRYKFEYFAVSPIAAGRKFAGYNMPVVDHYELKVEEDPNGEWVKWEDANESLEARAHLVSEMAILATGYELQIKALNKPPECNCAKMLARAMASGKSADCSTEWICPAHGYKRR